MIALRLLFALMLAAAPALAFAQDDNSGTNTDDTQSGKSDEAQPQQLDIGPPTDPIALLQGLWHVDHVEGKAATDAMRGSILKIDRQAIASLTGGTCANPTFLDGGGVLDTTAGPVSTVIIKCVGLELARVAINPALPDEVEWSEWDSQTSDFGVRVDLHRVKSATTAEKPAADSGEDDAQ